MLLHAHADLIRGRDEAAALLISTSKHSSIRRMERYNYYYLLLYAHGLFVAGDIAQPCITVWYNNFRLVDLLIAHGLNFETLHKTVTRY